MLHETIHLSESYPGATLTTYVSYDPPELKKTPRKAIVVCPGGGYHFLSDREGEPIVKEFLAAGLNALWGTNFMFLSRTDNNPMLNLVANIFGKFYVLGMGLLVIFKEM